MTRNHALLFQVVLIVTSVHGASLRAQNAKMRKEFLVNADRPFAYIKFDHIGPSACQEQGESAPRIWLRLTNNCRIPITVHANGVCDGSPKDEVGVNYEVVPDHPVLEISAEGAPLQEIEPRPNQNGREANSKADQVPPGTMSEVCSLVTIDPEEEILFNVPANTVSKKWHMEIPFEFDLPRGKGSRDPNNGGEPQMVISYGLWDLPPKAQEQLGDK